jgi:tetratricopeptide (TPR) repeat protein
MFLYRPLDDVSIPKAVYLNCGAFCNMKKDPDRALADFSEAVRLKPDYADAYMNRGNIHSDLSNLDQAIADYNKAINLKLDSAAAYVNRGTSP